MSDNTKTLIKNYFNSLVQEFIDSAHKDITIVFTDYIESNSSGDIAGLTKSKETGGSEHWQTLNGVEVPGTRWKEPHKYTYTIYFLNHYENDEEWHETVAHEFAHLYLFATVGKHTHDDNFYSHMEKFENWMDQKWNLTPRKDKSGDWNQHVDPSKHEERKKKECTGCGKREIPYSTSGKCFQCWQKNKEEVEEHNEQVAKHNEQIAKEGQEKDEWNRLYDLIKNSKYLATLEKNWQVIQNSPLYSNNKRSFEKYSGGEEFIDNKTELDKQYAKYKKRLQSSQNKENSNTNNNNSTNDEQKEYYQLVDLMKNAKSLPELEKAYQKVKNNSLYDSNKRTFKKFNNTSRTPEDNKTKLDKWYNDFKNKLLSSNETHEKSYPTSPKDNLIAPILVGVIILLFIILVIFASKKKRK